MNPAATDPQLRVRVLDSAPAAWDQFLARVPDAELSADPVWTELAARHYPGGRALWLVAESPAGEMLGGLPALARRRWQLERLESSFDGTVAGPLVAADLPDALQEQVFASLCRALSAQLGGRTILAALTVATPTACRRAAATARRGPYQAVTYQSSVVDCRPGLEHIEARVWSNNRRNERNRGLKRGCTLHVERDPELMRAWYPLYLRQARQWLQAPVPEGLLADLLRHCRDGALVVTVRHEGRLVGGHFSLVSRDRLVPFLSATDPDFLRTHFLHTLLYWQDIVHACEQGLSAVDFGGCAGRDSLWDFKRRCGGQPEERVQLQAHSPIGLQLRQLGAWRRRRRRSRG